MADVLSIFLLRPLLAAKVRPNNPIEKIEHLFFLDLVGTPNLIIH
jgi:hypothetical protein